MNWALRYHRDATAGLYKIERGRAAEITQAIEQLASSADPRIGADLIENDEIELPTFWIEAAAHFIEFQVVEEEDSGYIIITDVK